MERSCHALVKESCSPPAPRRSSRPRAPPPDVPRSRSRPREEPSPPCKGGAGGGCERSEPVARKQIEDHLPRTTTTARPPTLWRSESGRMTRGDLQSRASVARTVNQAARQVAPKGGVEHPQIDAHSSIGRVGRRPVRRTAAGRAVPKIERAIALLVRHARAVDADRARRAIMPQRCGAPAHRAIAFAGLHRLFPQAQAYRPAMSASLMLAYRPFPSKYRRRRTSHPA